MSQGKALRRTRGADFGFLLRLMLLLGKVLVFAFDSCRE